MAWLKSLFGGVALRLPFSLCTLLPVIFNRQRHLRANIWSCDREPLSELFLLIKSDTLKTYYSCTSQPVHISFPSLDQFMIF